MHTHFLQDYHAILKATEAASAAAAATSTANHTAANGSAHGTPLHRDSASSQEAGAFAYESDAEGSDLQVHA